MKDYLNIWKVFISLKQKMDSYEGKGRVLISAIYANGEEKHAEERVERTLTVGIIIKKNLPKKQILPPKLFYLLQINGLLSGFTTKVY